MTCEERTQTIRDIVNEALQFDASFVDDGSHMRTALRHVSSLTNTVTPCDSVAIRNYCQAHNITPPRY